MLATAAVVVGFNSLIGTPGIAVGAVVSLLIGNPISGAAIPAQFIAGPWGAVGQWFVPGAASTLVRSLSYFPDADTAPQWWTSPPGRPAASCSRSSVTSAAAPRFRCRRPSSTPSRPPPDGSHAAPREDGGREGAPLPASAPRARRHPLVPTRRTRHDRSAPLRIQGLGRAVRSRRAARVRRARRAGRPRLAFVSDHFQPWNHEGGHAPAAIPWLGALGARTSKIVLGTSVLTPSFRYHPGRRRTGVRDARRDVPRPDRARRRHRRGAQRGRARDTWPDIKERFARLKEAIGLIEQLWTEDDVTHDGPYFRTEHATIYDRPSGPCRSTSAPLAPRPPARGAAGAGGSRTSGKGPELYTDTPAARPAEGIAAAGRRRGRRPLMEMKVSFDHDASGAAGHPLLGAARADARGEDDVHDPRGDAAAGGCAADRAGRVALDRLDGSGRARGAHRGVPGPRVPAPRLPRSRRRPAALHRALRQRILPRLRARHPA